MPLWKSMEEFCSVTPQQLPRVPSAILTRHLSILESGMRRTDETGRRGGRGEGKGERERGKRMRKGREVGAEMAKPSPFPSLLIRSSPGSICANPAGRESRLFYDLLPHLNAEDKMCDDDALQFGA